MNTLYLVRHGENPANLNRQFSCKNVDYSLTPKGILQAQQTAEFFKHKHIHEIYTSPLKRAVETAQIIADAVGLTVTVIEEFREVNVGDLENHPPTDEHWRLHDDIFDAWFAGQHEVMFPGGENYLMLVERMRAGLRHVLSGKQGQNIVIVAHGGIFAASLRQICQNENIHELIQGHKPNCSVTQLTAHFMEDVLHSRLEHWAACEHLSDDTMRHQ